jgi:ABC-type phosphate transport system substrate-binding protein
MRRYAVTWLLACVALLASPLSGQAADTQETILVIVHKSAAVSALTRDDLRPFFQTKKNTWPDGSSVRPFNLPEGDAARRGFDAAVLGLDPDRVTRYWIDRKIRGGERAPQTAPSAALILAVVGKTPGALGYVDSKVTLNANVKVVAKIVGGQVLSP